MLKCPYCYEVLPKKLGRCPHCQLFIIDELVEVDYPSVEKKDCIFCGAKINQEAKYCLHCKKWFEEINRAIEDLDWDDLYTD